MKNGIMIAVAAIASTPVVAFAQPPEPTYQYQTGPAAPERRNWAQEPVRAPANAFEISVGTGYTQPFGMLRPGVGMPDVARPGIGFDLGLGYRFNPRWQLSVNGQYQEFNAERADSARGLTTSLAAQYHFTPMGRVDPWLELGTGYRLLWENPAVGPTILTHGLQLGRARAGIDFRVDESVALGPMIGADANLFLFEDVPGLDSNIEDPRFSTFIFAGLNGRFDVGGQRVEPATAENVARR